LKFAKDRLYGLCATPTARAEADAVQQRHGSRKSGLAPPGRATRRAPAATQPATAAVQGELF